MPAGPYMIVEFRRQVSPKPEMNRSAHPLVPIAFGRHGNQLPPNKLDAVLLREETELRQPLELGEGPAHPRHAVGDLRGWPSSGDARNLVHAASCWQPYRPGSSPIRGARPRSRLG